MTVVICLYWHDEEIDAVYVFSSGRSALHFVMQHEETCKNHHEIKPAYDLT